MEQQQGGRRSVGFSLACASLSLVCWYRQGSCICWKSLAAPSVVGGDAVLSLTAGDAHGCTWRRGKPAYIASKRHLLRLTSVACATRGVFFYKPLSRISEPSSSPHLRAAGNRTRGGGRSCVLPGPGGIGVPLGICPTQPAAQHIPTQLCLCPGHSKVFWSNPTTPLLLAQVQRNQREGTGC